MKLPQVLLYSALTLPASLGWEVPQAEPIQVSLPRKFVLQTAPADSASFYPNSLQGKLTASGTHFNNATFTAAHRTVPFNTPVTLCRADRPWRCVSLTVVDRGPFKPGRSWDLSQAAARKLGMLTAGVVAVFTKACGNPSESLQDSPCQP